MPRRRAAGRRERAAKNIRRADTGIAPSRARMRASPSPQDGLTRHRIPLRVSPQRLPSYRCFGSSPNAPERIESPWPVNPQNNSNIFDALTGARPGRGSSESDQKRATADLTRDSRKSGRGAGRPTREPAAGGPDRANDRRERFDCLGVVQAFRAEPRAWHTGWPSRTKAARAAQLSILFSVPFPYAHWHGPAKSLKRLVELRGIEPLTSAVRLQRSPI